MKKRFKKFLKKLLGINLYSELSEYISKKNSYKYRDNLQVLADKIHFNILGRHIDWENPCDINEKINWMKFNADTKEWTRLADKYSVREYIEQKGFGDMLISLYGKWDRANEINFDILKYPCILKVNHGSGGNYLLKLKPSKSMQRKLVRKLNKVLETPYGYETAEPHYLPMKTCIIAEQFLIEKENSFSTSLVDYKVWCFNGVVDSIWAAFNREKHSVFVSAFDTHWNYHPEWSVFTSHYKMGGDIPKPELLSRMLDAASVLSKGFPQVRIDFYEVNGKVYFGEMTFTSQGGYMEYFTYDFLLEMGKKCIMK